MTSVTTCCSIDGKNGHDEFRYSCFFSAAVSFGRKSAERLIENRPQSQRRSSTQSTAIISLICRIFYSRRNARIDSVNSKSENCVKSRIYLSFVNESGEAKIGERKNMILFILFTHSDFEPQSRMCALVISVCVALY